MNNLYQYIYKVGDGYQIRKNGESYGWYPLLSDALYDRDDLVECNWDLEEWVWLPQRPNPYEGVTLPPMDLEVKRPYQYIYARGNGTFRICKRVDGKQINYGSYHSLEEAIEKRNELVMNNWRVRE